MSSSLIAGTLSGCGVMAAAVDLKSIGLYREGSNPSTHIYGHVAQLVVALDC